MIWGVVLFSYLYGLYSGKFGLFPAPMVDMAVSPAEKLVAKMTGQVAIPYKLSKARGGAFPIHPERMQPGLTLMSGAGPQGALFVKLIDANGVTKHAWDLDWFDHWPNPDHVPARERPKQRPGTHIHGIVLSPNGDLTYNYEHLGMVKVDACGHVKWRLPRFTHHSLFEDESGNLWTSEASTSPNPPADFPGYQPPYFTYHILQVSPEGKILQEINVLDLLRRNHLAGLLYESSLENDSPRPAGDILHINDVEVFPASMKPGLFHPGDIMVSFRNLNAILVFDPKTGLVRALEVGRFVRQHDANFIDGSTISVFDNNNVGDPPGRASSRIVEYSFADGHEKVVFEGDARHPFFTNIMGKQRRLENGGLLFTEAVEGRILETDREGDVIWTYNNIVRPGVAGLVEEAQRISPNFMSEARLAEIHAQCLKTARP